MKKIAAVAKQIDYNKDSKTDIPSFKKGKWIINDRQASNLGSRGGIAAPADYMDKSELYSL